MDRWRVPTDRALHLIGHNGGQRGRDGKPNFRMSEKQAKVLSCLLEIDLTLAVGGMSPHRLHRPIRSRRMGKVSPLEAMGRCDPSRTAAVLWILNRPAA